ENEIRGGNYVKFAAPPAGKSFSLTATQVLDSNFATFGVLTGINATDSASATAGLSSAENADETPLDQYNKYTSTPLFDQAFTKLTEQYGPSATTASHATANQGSTGASTALNVAGALAFSFTDHKALTHIGGTADLNSNDDMELRSELVENLQLSAESDSEPQKNDGTFKPGASA